MVKFFGKIHVFGVVSAILYIIIAFIAAISAGIIGSATFWISLIFLLISLAAFLAPVFIKQKDAIPPFFFMITQQMYYFYITELILSAILLIINLIVKDDFPHIVNLIQIPIVVIYAAWAAMIVSRQKYVAAQIHEEKATVRMQSTVAAMIDKSAALGYSYKVSDSVDELTMKIRTMGLGSDPGVQSIDAQIIDRINTLNGKMRDKEPEDAVINEMRSIQNLIDYRRSMNRRY